MLTLEAPEVTADRVDLSDHLLQASPRNPIPSQRRVTFIAERGVDEGADTCARRERQLVVLSDDRDPAHRDPSESAVRGRRVVDVGTRPIPIDRPTEDELRISLDESGGDVSSLGSGADDALSSFVTTEESKRSEHQRLACPRLARDDGQTGSEMDLGVLDQAEVLCGQLVKHDRGRTGLGPPAGTDGDRA